ncbi:hypothetical protein TPAU25S_03362 [Tsukamurella paurometabola]|uniref:HNH endonuclease signature motif containing protein n=1 Tax=Tsukamurella paurometabola TaxID=2061 RepID=UPI00019F0890|nr:HNH endonuclease signature motif containing protein [Tsukamurella paurometabola]SUP34691.1 Uncharacterised protein [Tsukamurella paurometabola]
MHHITEWADGGATDITGLTLACDAHHGKVTPGTRDFPRGWETITVRDGEYAGRTGWRRTADPSQDHRTNHRHHPDELYREALQRWRHHHEKFLQVWRDEDRRVQYESFIGSIHDDIAAILDGPNGPPILETLLAEHDADNAWRPCESPAPPLAAA